MRTLLAVTAALLLAACGECDCCKEGAPQQKPAAEKATGPAPKDAPRSVPEDPRDDNVVQAVEELPRQPPKVSVAWRGSGDVIELSVWEMHCPGCEALVEEGFQAVAGVKGVEADHETSVVKVTLKDAKERETVIAKLPAALASVNAKEQKEFRVLGR